MAETTDHLTMEEKFTQLKKAKHIEPECPKIQKVAHFLRDRQQFTDHYLPKLMSFGPIHHGKKSLKQGEKYKLMWANNYLERTTQVAESVHKKIADNIEELKDLFTEDAIEGFPDNKDLSWMLFVDGCSLLEIMEKAYTDRKELHIKDDQLVLVLLDLLLLENQLPCKVLKLLSVDGNECKLMERMDEFLRRYPLLKDLVPSPPPPIQGNSCPNQVTIHVPPDQAQPLAVHILHHLRRTLLGDKKDDKTNSKQKEDITHRNNRSQPQPMSLPLPQPRSRSLPTQLKSWPLRQQWSRRQQQPDALPLTQTQPEARNEGITYSHRNIQELKTAGIKVKRSKSGGLRSIDFKSSWFRAKLKLPEITVDDSTVPIFLNLIAYEMCPDFKDDYGVSSFVAFMDSLIDHPSDVKELRYAMVLHNGLGSDEEVSELFNIISKDLVIDMGEYSNVRNQIEKHYTSQWNSWIAQAYHTYFSTPWAIIGFHAAFIALVLTFIQTWYSINNQGS